MGNHQNSPKSSICPKKNAPESTTIDELKPTGIKLPSISGDNQ